MKIVYNPGMTNLTPPPTPDRDVRRHEYLTVNIYYLGLTVLTQTLAPLVIPLLVQQFVGEEQQGRYFGIARLGALMAALLAQALMGMLSDRCASRWGRRRPFVVAGTFACLAAVVGIGFSSGMAGMAGFWLLFVLYALQQMSANTAQSAVQSLIPDLVPEKKRGIFSGIKALFELPVPMVLVSFTIAPLIGAGKLWSGLAVLMGILFVVMLLALTVSETPLRERPAPLDWRPFLRLVMMTALFTSIILAMSEAVKVVGRMLLGIESRPVLLLGMGVAGFVGMATTIVLGVRACVRLSVGAQAERQARSFIWWVTSRLAFLVGATNLAGFVLYYLQTRLGYTRESAAGPASRMMLMIGVAVLATALPAGWLTDKFGRKGMVILSGLIAGLGALVTLFATHINVIYVGGCVIGVATGIFYTASWALGTSLISDAEAGRYLGLSNLAGAGAGAVGAYIGGPVADFFTRYAPDAPGLGYVLLFVIYGLLFFLSSAMLLNVKVHTGD
ncbi:MAG: MFS transporter [Anaerolineae bacterium]|nr:MFS transporter [Anaerolineae bacterium]